MSKLTRCISAARLGAGRWGLSSPLLADGGAETRSTAAAADTPSDMGHRTQRSRSQNENGCAEREREMRHKSSCPMNDKCGESWRKEGAFDFEGVT